MDIVIHTILTALVIAFILGVLLGLFKLVFHVNTDQKVLDVREALSGANCGGCGMAGCDAFAGAVVKGEADTNGCIAGGAATAAKIAEILGKAGAQIKPKVALLACNGTKDCTADKGIYNGVKTCAAANLVTNGTKKCSYGCIGFGDCVQACPFEALSMGREGLPIVDYSKCVACGKCQKACPKKLFHIIDKEIKGAVALCSNKSQNKAQIRKDCSKGCFKCGICEKKCPEGAISILSGIPEIDYGKCTGCGECVAACPDKVLHLAQDLIK